MYAYEMFDDVTKNCEVRTGGAKKADGVATDSDNRNAIKLCTVKRFGGFMYGFIITASCGTEGVAVFHAVSFEVTLLYPA